MATLITRHFWNARYATQNKPSHNSKIRNQVINHLGFNHNIWLVGTNGFSSRKWETSFILCKLILEQVQITEYYTNAYYIAVSHKSA